MADKRVSELQETTHITGSDYLLITQDRESKKIKANTFLTADSNIVMILKQNTITSDMKLSEFPTDKICYTICGGTIASGYPTLSAGMLMINTLGGKGFAYQIYHVYDSTRVFKRVSNSIDGEWGPFVEISASIV